jgi:type I restriction-modification system DNA methylase subunit
MKKLQKFETILDSLARRYGVHQVFSDFLTLLICAFSLGRMEKHYFETIRKYEKPYTNSFSEALAALVIEMTGPDGNGFIDVLGDYFEQHLSFDKNGQFFTPQLVCDMMARMITPSGTGKRVADPACGSGRMLMAMEKVNRFALFYGADNDVNCAKMAVINLCLNSMFGEIAWMNSLTNQFYAAWEIFPSIKGIPCIRAITEKESYIHLKLPKSKKETIKISSQQLVFEF